MYQARIYSIRWKTIALTMFLSTKYLLLNLFALLLLSISRKNSIYIKLSNFHQGIISKPNLERVREMFNNSNNTLITVDPYQGNEWIKWGSATIYLGSMISCGFLGKTVWKEMSKKMVLFSFRPVTQQLVTFAIIEVSEE